MEAEGRSVENNALVPMSIGKDGHLLVTQGGSDFEHSANGNEVFYASSQAARTWSVALNTTHTGLVVYNPLTSNRNLIILQAGFALSVAPVAIATIGLFGGYSTTGIITHTTPLSVYSTKIGRAAGYGAADEAATLVGTPTWIMPLMSGFTAGALPSTSPSMVNINGSIIVPPGAYIGIGALTAVIGFGSIIWKEDAV